MPRANALCAEPGCGEIVPPGVRRCARHRAAVEARRGSRTARGYGAAHDAVRRRLLAAFVPGTPCWRCGRPMLAGQALAADHSTVPASAGGVADVLAHEWCNSGKREPTRDVERVRPDQDR